MAQGNFDGMQSSILDGVCCIASGNYATITNYLPAELRYMKAGERGPKSAKAGPEGHRVTNRHVIDYNFGARPGCAALGGTDLRRSRAARAGGDRPRRKLHIPRLRARLGRLH